MDSRKQTTSRKSKGGSRITAIVPEFPLPPCCVFQKKYENQLVQIFVAGTEVSGYLQVTGSSVFVVQFPKTDSPPKNDPSYLFQLQSPSIKSRHRPKTITTTEITCRSLLNGSYISRIPRGKAICSSTSLSELSTIVTRHDQRWGIPKPLSKEFSFFSTNFKHQKSKIFVCRGESSLHFSAISVHLEEISLPPLLFQRALREKDQEKLSELVRQSPPSLMENTSPLHWAATMTDDPDLFLFIFDLVNLNAEFRLTDRDLSLNTPLHLAVAHNNLLIAKLLLDKGANVCLFNDLGATPFHRLCQIAPNDPVLFTELLETMITLKPTVATSKNRVGFAPLHYCCSNPSFPSSALHLLLESPSINLNVENSQFITPIEYSVLDGNKVIVEAMIRAGAGLSPSSRKEMAKSEQLSQLLPLFVEEATKKAAKKKKVDLDLSVCKLDVLPECSLKVFTETRTLNLQRNSLSELPEQALEASSLRKVNLSHNCFSVWPPFKYSLMIKVVFHLFPFGTFGFL